MTSIWDSGIHFILWLQGLGHWLQAPMAGFTFLGTEQFYLLIMPVLLWCVDAGWAFAWGWCFC